MPHDDSTEVQDGVTGRKFYLPAGVSASFEASRLKRLWSGLFDHQV